MGTSLGERALIRARAKTFARRSRTCYMTVDLLVPSFLSQKIGKGGNECT